MKSLKNTKAVLTGMFVVAALAILITGIFLVGSKSKSFSKTITVKAVFNDVDGLGKGNNVWYAGVVVGTVKKIAFMGSGVEVSFNIAQSALQYIHTDTKAKLGSDGLIGNRIIVLYDGSPSAPLIKTGNYISVKNAVSTEEMMSTLQENNKNLLQITNNFKAISHSLMNGDGIIGKLLTDERLINSMQATMLTLKKASANTEILTSNLSDFSDKLHTKGSLANELVTDTIVFAKLRSTVAQIQEVSLHANSVIKNLDNTTKELNNTNGTVGLLLNDKETAGNFKNTMLNLEAGTQKLDENMEALQHNFLIRGFFRKKAKAAEKLRYGNTVSIKN